MTRAVVVLVVASACGSKPAPPPAPPSHVEPIAKRVPIEDTEPDDNVQVQYAHGHMEQDAINSGLQQHTEELSDCYTQQVDKRKWLGGHVVLHWDVKADGDITSVKVSESDLGAWPIEKCLLDSARSMTFGKPVGGAADFTIPLEFTLKGGSADAWDDDRTIKAIGKQLAKLDACGKGGEPVPNEVTVTFYVGARGVVQSVGFSSPKSEITDKWSDCAVKAAMAWKLPDPRGQVAKLAVRYR
jgi:hypothetical protein|nr:AgmX/PglI C-terminal domain-containing protein [Kofleriaceae bacterium]